SLCSALMFIMSAPIYACIGSTGDILTRAKDTEVTDTNNMTNFKKITIRSFMISLNCNDVSVLSRLTLVLPLPLRYKFSDLPTVTVWLNFLFPYLHGFINVI